MVILVPAKKLYITFEDMGLQTFVLATEIVSNTKNMCKSCYSQNNSEKYANVLGLKILRLSIFFLFPKCLLGFIYV